MNPDVVQLKPDQKSLSFSKSLKKPVQNLESNENCWNMKLLQLSNRLCPCKLSMPHDAPSMFYCHVRGSFVRIIFLLCLLRTLGWVASCLRKIYFTLTCFFFIEYLIAMILLSSHQTILTFFRLFWSWCTNLYGKFYQDFIDNTRHFILYYFLYFATTLLLTS